MGFRAPTTDMVTRLGGCWVATHLERFCRHSWHIETQGQLDHPIHVIRAHPEYAVVVRVLVCNEPRARERTYGVRFRHAQP